MSLSTPDSCTVVFREQQFTLHQDFTNLGHIPSHHHFSTLQTEAPQLLSLSHKETTLLLSISVALLHTFCNYHTLLGRRDCISTQ